MLNQIEVCAGKSRSREQTTCNGYLASRGRGVRNVVLMISKLGVSVARFFVDAGGVSVIG